MSFFGWKPYVSVAERRKKAERAAARFKKTGVTLSPVTGARGAIAKTFWGKAWCANLEHYSDFSNRLPRGRTYLRNGSVIDLKIAQGEVQAQVMGSNLYKVAVSIAPAPKKQWKAIGVDCSGSIDSLVELLQGRLSKGVMERICRPHTRRQAYYGIWRPRAKRFQNDAQTRGRQKIVRLKRAGQRVRGTAI